MQRAWLGSVSTRVRTEADNPVLICPPAEREDRERIEPVVILGLVPSLAAVPFAVNRLEDQDLRPDLAVFRVEQPERVIRLPPPVRRTAGVEKHQPAFIIQPGDVRVPEHDDAGPREPAPHPVPAPLLRARVVDHGGSDAPDLELQRLGQSHVPPVHVPLHGTHRRVVFQLVKHVLHQEIPGVQDQISRFEMRRQPLRQPFRPTRNMRVGEHYSE